ncbi:MAG: DUF1178 family protein [Rhodospirillales bacterium]|nr:DUF1178 family protein [Rhodospirillales bacterium]
MILYQLSCDDEHTFEAWFRDSGAYDEQAKNGHVECPYCGSTKVAKAPMAPRIVSGVSDRAAEPTSSSDGEWDINKMDQNRAQEVAQKILDAVGNIREYAEKNLENVGDEFAEEALKIHHGETQERGIYGRASEDEARELEKEGVQFVRLPGTPRRNG